MGAAQEFHERGDPVEIIINAGSRAGNEIAVEIIRMRWQLAIHDSNRRQLKVGGASPFKHGAEHFWVPVKLVGNGLVDAAGFQNRDMHGGVLRNGTLSVLNVRLSIYGRCICPASGDLLLERVEHEQPDGRRQAATATVVDLCDQACDGCAAKLGNSCQFLPKPVLE